MLPVAGATDQATVVPVGRFFTENVLVPAGAMVALDGLTLGAADAVSVTVAVPRTACVEEFFAVRVAFCCVATVAGAVNKPVASTLPAVTDHAAVTPEGRLSTENCLVAAGATVALAGLTLGVGDAVSVTVAVPRTASVEEFFAVRVALCCVATVVGAVNRPLALTLPAVTDHAAVTPEGKFSTENCLVAAGATVAVAGLTLIAGDAVSVSVAVPRTASVEEFFTVRVTFCCVATVAGAVNRPLALTLPPVTDHAAVTPEGRFSTENCWVAAGATVAVAGLTLIAGDAVNVIVAVPRAACVEASFAVTMTLN
jgi:hypothetical protein